MLSRRVVHKVKDGVEAVGMGVVCGVGELAVAR
jgi:hypothetical protein